MAAVLKLAGQTLQLPSHVPRSCAVAASRYLHPLGQGELDGLCGLYCIINGIRLALAPQRTLTQLESRQLFQVGIRHLGQYGALPQAVGRSMSKSTWTRLARKLSLACADVTEINVALVPPSRRRHMNAATAISLIEQIIVVGSPVLVFMRGKYRHYSVVSGYTPATLKLFDSYGYKFVMKSSCGTSRSSPRTLHRFDIESMLSVRVARGK